MSLWSKAKKAVKKGFEAVTQPIHDTAIGLRKDIQAGANLLQGDIKGFADDFVGARKEIAEGGAGTMLPGAQAYAPNLIKTVGKTSEALNAYATGNFNRGSQAVEDLTGFDVDNSIAEAKERAAKEAYQAEVDAANAAAERNRRANLLSLRKSLTPSLSRSSQGGAAASSMAKSQGGIILG